MKGEEWVMGSGKVCVEMEVIGRMYVNECCVDCRWSVCLSGVRQG